jgi:hypothetical protein
VRIRIALTTAVAVLFIIPAVLFALLNSASSASTATGRHEVVVSRHRASSVGMNLMSYRRAEQVLNLVTAVQNQKEQSYLSEVAYLQAAASEQANIMPAAWVATARCEEGGRNDPYAGYFGILEWNGFDGYPTAGSAPLSVQLAWEAAHGQGPPDAPGRCHSY